VKRQTFLVIVAMLVLAACVPLVSCGGSSSGKPAATATFSQLEPLTAVGGSPTAAAPQASPSPSDTATPSPSPTPSADARTTALNAALKIFDGVPAADCSTSNPGGKDCVNWSTTPSTPALGVAAFNVGSPQGGGALMVTGLEADGVTWGRWFGTQQALYQAVALPAAMLVCAGGQGLAVYQDASTSSAAVGTVPDGKTVQAEQFVLTSPGSARSNGSGMYRLSSPIQGWADATDLSVASLGDCSTHDALQGGGFDRG
jgi:hypothetical protein